jgi:triphosphoribosyl-dephospho-CoA synthase
MDPDYERKLHDWTALACIWEATAHKAGNVNPERSFRDLAYSEFIISAVAIAPVLATAQRDGVGKVVLGAIEATRRLVRSNTNLGIVLLLAPMAAASPSGTLRETLPAVLDHLTVEDSRRVYEAIRVAAPGGMGKAAEQDVGSVPTLPLRDVMALAQERDAIARQYVNGFREVLDEGVPALVQRARSWGAIEPAIIGAHLELLARRADSLIARKCGQAVATEATSRARAVLRAGWPRLAAARRLFDEFDAWLRADGNRRNPGTSADLVTACIFAALRDNNIGTPVAWSWSET